MSIGPGFTPAPEVYWNSHSVLGRDAEVHLLANKLLEERVAVVAGLRRCPPRSYAFTRHADHSF